MRGSPPTAPMGRRPAGEGPWMITIAAAGRTDQGRVRPHNEDAFFIDATRGVFAVADGMGGHAAGEVASRLAIEALTAALAERPDDDEDAANMLRAAIEAANRRIAAHGLESPEHHHMGTTIVGALVVGDRFWIAHVGDSRAYLIRDADIVQLTSDHSFVNELVRLGMLSREQAARDPRRNVVTRALGSGIAVAPDLYEGQARPGDLLLLCSDGLNTMLDDQQILSVLGRDGGDLESACAALIDAANAAGGEDNVTVVVLSFRDASSSPPSSAP